MLDGMVMDGQHGQIGMEIHIHSAGVFHGYQEDGGECHTGQCIATHIPCHGYILTIAIIHHGTAYTAITGIHTGDRFLFLK